MTIDIKYFDKMMQLVDHNWPYFNGQKIHFIVMNEIKLSNITNGEARACDYNTMND